MDDRQRAHVEKADTFMRQAAEAPRFGATMMRRAFVQAAELHLVLSSVTIDEEKEMLAEIDAEARTKMDEEMALLLALDDVGEDGPD